MTVDDFKARVEELDKSLEQTVANFNMLQGRKQECLEAIAKFEEVDVIPSQEA